MSNYKDNCYKNIFEKEIQKVISFEKKKSKKVIY